MTAPSDREEQRDFLLRSITDLDREYAAGDIAEADYRALRDDYTARAAAVLRATDAPPPAQPARASSRHGWRPLAWVLGVLLVAVGAGWFVASSAGERVAGDTATGSVPEASTDRIARAQRLVRDGEVLEAIKVYDDLLADDPENPVALAERGWLLSRVDQSLVDRGLEGIDQALALDPAYAEAHFYRGMILLQAKNDRAGAAAAFRAALDSGPPPDLRAYLDDAVQRAEQAST